MTNKRYKEFESHMSEPVNTSGNQCECLREEYRPFILGGDVHPVVQCKNNANVKIISHAAHEKDYPPMYLCNDCLKLFKKDNTDNISDYEIIEV